MANRYDSFDNGAPTEDRLKFSKTNVGFSAHNFSCTHAGNYVLGMLAPVDCFDVVPTEKLDMSISAVLEFRNPTTRKLFNGFRTFFHCRYNRFIDVWEGGRNFIDHGRTGKIDLSRPNAIYFNDSGYAISASVTVNKVNANTPLSLLDFLGMPPEALQTSIGQIGARTRSPLRSFQTANKVTGGSYTNDYVKLGEHTSFFPADCLMAYQRNWRDFYSNKNLLQNNKYWFPDNEDHFILSYSCQNACAILYENEDFSSYPLSSSQNEEQCKNLCDLDSDDIEYTPEPNNPATNSNQFSISQAPNLAGIKFVQMRGDRFTTASPFPDLIRGDIPILQLTEDNFVRATVTKSADPSTIGTSAPVSGLSAVSSSAPVYRSGFSESFSFGSSDDSGRFSLTIPESSVTMSDLYTLETLTAFKRKLGMTNGDYNESIEAMFGQSPKVHDRRGTYVGGFYIDWNQDGVIQQSESGTTPLGTKAGIGMAVGSGSLGHFEVPDFGWIQTYMFTVSDVYYTQGKPRMYSKSQSIELYFPLFNNLPAQAIRNDELFISGNSATDALPFAYEDRYAEYKGRHNRVSGFMGLSHSVAAYDASRIMARRFTSTPSLNSQFVTYLPENTDMDVFAVNDEPPIDFNVAIQVRRVFPGPYMAIEGSLSSPALN